MPALGSKGKGKPKDVRARSRNSTPVSQVGAPSNGSPVASSKLDTPVNQIMVPRNLLYEDIFERHGSGKEIPELKHLETLQKDLNELSQLAEAREDACSAMMRSLSKPWKEAIEDERERAQASLEAEEKANLKRAAEDNDIDKSSKSKMKKRKEQGKVKEERPLTHGAHGVARQDGAPSPKGNRASSAKLAEDSGSSSSLSPPSQAQSPAVPQQADATATKADGSDSDSSSSSDDERQPKPAPSVPHFQTFGVNPLEFDDPTVYHIRDVTPDMMDDEKREIYNVAVFPRSDLRELTAGIPPDKDFSNAKPSNQVNANTFAAYIEPYFRLLTEEDMAFLRERGDRVTPFIMPKRGTKHYTQVWAEEDGTSTSGVYHPTDRLPPNQGRGNIDQIDDDTAETDKVSIGPVTARFLSLLRYEHRPESTEKTNGTNGTNGTANGDGGPSGSGGGTNGTFPTNGLDFLNGDLSLKDGAAGGDTGDSLPAATQFPELSTSSFKTPGPKQDYASADERLKMELRYLGFLGADDEPDYDSHRDDEVAQRLRLLQAELRRVMVINGARKARLAQIADEFMGYQEFAHIRDDLDTQVNQAFQKRNRTLGKGKKNAKRPGGAAAAALAAGMGVSRPGIGDAARTIMDRRRRWNDTISPIWSRNVTTMRAEGDSIFDEEDMKPFIAAEKERLEEEAE